MIYGFLLWAAIGSIWDIRCRKVPVWWLMFGGVGAVGIGISRVFQLAADRSLLQEWALAAILGFVPGMLFVLISLIGKGTIGLADGCFLLILGGIFGSAQAWGSALLGILLAAVAAGIGLWTKQLNRKSRLPLLPLFTAAWCLIQVCGIQFPY